MTAIKNSLSIFFFISLVKPCIVDVRLKLNKANSSVHVHQGRMLRSRNGWLFGLDQWEDRVSQQWPMTVMRMVVGMLWLARLSKMQVTLLFWDFQGEVSSNGNAAFVTIDQSQSSKLTKPFLLSSYTELLNMWSQACDKLGEGTERG